MIKTYQITSNLILKIDYSKYKDEIIHAFVNRILKPNEEDESGTKMFWDLSNYIAAKEAGHIEYEVEFFMDDLIDEIYSDLPKISIKMAKNILKGKNA